MRWFLQVSFGYAKHLTPYAYQKTYTRQVRDRSNLSSIYAGPLVLFLASPLAVLFPLCEWR